MKKTDKDNNKGGGTQKQTIARMVKKLGTDAWIAGDGPQHHHSKMLETVTDCAGEHHSMSVRPSIKTSIDQAPTEPSDPIKEELDSPIEMKLWEKKVDQCDKLIIAYQLNKEKVFIIILEQCDIAPFKQIKAESNHNTIETSADTPSSLQIIKSIVHNNKSTQHDWPFGMH